MAHHGPSVQNLDTVPLYSVHPTARAAFTELAARHLPGTGNETIGRLAGSYAAINGTFRRSPQRGTRGGREGDWLRISVNELAESMGATRTTAKRRISQLRQLGLVSYVRLGYGAADWFLSVHDFPFETLKSTAAQPRDQFGPHMRTTLVPPSYMSQEKNQPRGGDSIQKKTNSPEQERLLRENPQVKKTYDALCGRGMRQPFENFLAIVGESGDASPAVVNRALLNIESSGLWTVTAITWQTNVERAKTDIAKEPAELKRYVLGDGTIC